MTVMRVVVQGQQKGQSTTYRWDLLDRYDASTGLRSMSRTTAFPATIVASLICTGAFRRPGVCAPEVLGREPGILDTVIGELEQRGVRCSASVERAEAASAATPVGVTAQPRSAA
jgi:saccharopine dehydrogenase-like NADP-dependent oxidoreductase